MFDILYKWLGFFNIFAIYSKFNIYNNKVECLDKINEIYEALNNARSETCYYYYWSSSSGSVDESNAQEARILELDTILDELKEMYDKVNESNINNFEQTIESLSKSLKSKQCRDIASLYISRNGNTNNNLNSK
ncbi:hypothetical protein cand_038710 [Cryptosporidium andersoni]|uniref:Uncharacterized protein n=1 Tax=Cryptosporidium andersoni TaxID=117008 RepID=A0A1J4MBQ1_9CRYT|nr:hypothetical protein cand_038710 [Cryptosporidium andersoni]